MALLPPVGLLGGYAGDPDGVNGSWEKACTSVVTVHGVRASPRYPLLAGDAAVSAENANEQF